MKKNILLQQAFEEAAKREIDNLPKEEQIIRPYSEKFTSEMALLISGEDKAENKPIYNRKRKGVRWTAVIAAVLMAVVLATSALAGDGMSKLFNLGTGGGGNTNTVDVEVEDSYMTGRADKSMSEIVYKGDKITLKYNIDTGEAFDWPDRGIMIYLDGVKQTFDVRSSEGEYKDIEMFRLKNEKGTERHVEFTFEPNVGKAGEELFLSVVEVFDPDVTYYVQCKTDHKELFVGHWDDDNDRICDKCSVNIDEIPNGPSSYTMHTCVWARVVMEKDAPVKTEITSDFSGAVTDELAKIIYESYDSENLAGDKWNDYDTIQGLGVDLYKNLKDCYFYEWGALCSTTRIETEAKAEDDFIINLHGRTGKYRVSIYINNEIQNVFDGAAYTDVDVVHGEQVELNIKLDTTKLPEGDNYCYIMTENLDDEVSHFIGTSNSEIYTIELK